MVWNTNINQNNYQSETSIVLSFKLSSYNRLPRNFYIYPGFAWSSLKMTEMSVNICQEDLAIVFCLFVCGRNQSHLHYSRSASSKIQELYNHGRFYLVSEQIVQAMCSWAVFSSELTSLWEFYRDGASKSIINQKKCPLDLPRGKS